MMRATRARGTCAALALVPFALGCAELESANDVRITIAGPDTVEVGASVRLTADTANGIHESYRWRSDDETVATVDRGGRVAGRHTGEVLISATGAVTDQTGTHRVTVVDRDMGEMPDAGLAVDAAHADAGLDAGDASAPATGDDADAGDAGEPDAGDVGAPSFADDVHPILLARCNGCHVAGGVAAGSDFVLVDDAMLDRETVLDLVDTADPEASELLVKARGEANHAGAIVLMPTSEEYATLRDWIAAGALP